MANMDILEQQPPSVIGRPTSEVLAGMPDIQRAQSRRCSLGECYIAYFDGDNTVFIEDSKGISGTETKGNGIIVDVMPREDFRANVLSIYYGVAPACAITPSHDFTPQEYIDLAAGIEIGDFDAVAGITYDTQTAYLDELESLNNPDVLPLSASAGRMALAAS